MWRSILFLLACLSISFGEDATETETFSIAITPKLFNWTYQEFDKQFTYHPSIITKPDLPNWLHYVYSIRHRSGFIYGTPPPGQKDVTLEIVALNREDYETRRIIIPVHIKSKPKKATNHVQLKIDNLNVEDLLDDYRMERLKDIFRKKLWKESADELYVTFMASAIEMGARLPLRPTEGNGVVLKLGSHKDWSTELVQLQEEVKPLSKLNWCPRDFKRTTVERLFRDAGFNLDWCTFRLVDSTPLSLQSDKDNNRLRFPSGDSPFQDNVWLPRPPTSANVPQRSYAFEFFFTILIPFLIVILIVGCLSILFCFQNDDSHDLESEIFFRDIFHICSDYMKEKSECCVLPQSEGKLEGHSDISGMTLANAGTSEILLGDDSSNKGVSPNASLKPKSVQDIDVDYNRPQPPPYLGSNTNTLVQKHRQPAQEKLLSNRAQSLEESLQLLNEANISNRAFRVENILYPERVFMGDLIMSDTIGGNAIDEDYILIKPENEPLTMRHECKEIRNRGNVNNGNIKGYGNKI